MTPLKSKKDEIVAKALFEAKNNMKKINHPLTGFLMGDEGSSYAVQLNDTKSNPDTEMMAEQKDGDKHHNDTIKGAIVKFAKHIKLHEKKDEEKPKEIAKVEKKEEKPIAKEEKKENKK